MYLVRLVNSEAVPECIPHWILANLTYAKGLDIVLESFRDCIAEEVMCNYAWLDLVGPLRPSNSSPSVNVRIAGSMTYVGAVYGESKEKFFNSIDCFIFPSEYEDHGALCSMKPLLPACP